MHNNRLLLVDRFSDIFELLEPWVDSDIIDLDSFDPQPGSICVVGREKFTKNVSRIRQLTDRGNQIIFANSAEGSSTLITQINQLGINDLIEQQKVLLISGGRLPDQYPYLLHEHFFVRIVKYRENLESMRDIEKIFDQTDKPYDFLFLNGRCRPHRKYLWHRFQDLGLLDRSLWTMMDARGVNGGTLSHDRLKDTTITRSLPREYEVSRYRHIDATSTTDRFIKHAIFGGEWGEIYLELAPYRDTYFSVVTETILERPYSFFTEKIAKPLAQGHPWIAASNRGFYQDLRDLGFRTFQGIIDEKFDTIDNDQDRMDRIIKVVQDLCRQDLVSFLSACRDTCKYNQQHLLALAHQENTTFSNRFFQFVDHYG